MRRKCLRWLYGVAMAFAISAVLFFVVKKHVADDDAENGLRVLAYASFTSAWGPGPELVKMFEAEMAKSGRTGTRIILMQAEDAGLLLLKMRLFSADVVLGFDQLGRSLALKTEAWRAHEIVKAKFSDDKFLAFDWAPMGFIYRKGEIDPPKDFSDLLSPRFKDAIALQDPRSSSPGFQFLDWLVSEMGEKAAFEFLRNLKPNVQSTSGSWSQSYGIFSRGLAKLTFGYETSILYHRLSENDDRYEFARFPIKHPAQIEFAVISENCRRCELAKEFLEFLVRPEAQKVLMTKNWMLPINASAAKGTPFEAILKNATAVTLKKDIDSEALLKRWREAVL